MRWNAFKFLALTVVLQFLSAMSAQARIHYDWDDGKLHGWRHVKSSSAKAGYYDLSFAPVENEHICRADEDGFFLGENQENDDREMDWAKWPEPGSGAHQTVWIESPAFKLDGSGPLTYYAAGSEGPINPGTGKRDMSLVGMSIPDIAGTWGAESKNDPSTTGIIAVGLRDVATGEFVLSKNFQGGYGWKLDKVHTFTIEELAPFVNNGRAYTLDVVDALCGRYSWCAIDDVTIPGKLLVPEPTNFGKMAFGCGILISAVGGFVFVVKAQNRNSMKGVSEQRQSG